MPEFLSACIPMLRQKLRNELIVHSSIAAKYMEDSYFRSSFCIGGKNRNLSAKAKDEERQ
jgi:hypothetical protein